MILLTPRIVRTHELTQENLNPIYIGSQMNLGLSGPPPLIGAEPAAGRLRNRAAAPPATPPAGRAAGGTPSPTLPPRRRHRRRRR